MQIIIEVANVSHHKYADTICQMMGAAAEIRGTGIAKRKPEYVQLKMSEGKAVIALDDNAVVGFCYIESWENEKYVANSGLIVHPKYRKTGLAQRIKARIFQLSIEKFPAAKLFGITTSMAVMKINASLGYQPVTFSELTQDETFWDGCRSCGNYDILQRTNKTMCLCTGMVCDLKSVPNKPNKQIQKKAWERFIQFIKFRKLRLLAKAKQYPKLNKLSNNEK
ncbi:MAG: N-acetylglutamate synthase-like GNAT family acetyltransferase [Crocinitomix sp.]